MENFDINLNVDSASGKKHYGFHVQAEDEEQARAILAADLTLVLAQLPAPAKAGAAPAKKAAPKKKAPAKKAAPKKKAPAKKAS